MLLKVSDHHLHLGKMNDRYDGPYFVITVFDNGVIRVKEEARPDRPPKMVHHDRVRRFVQEEPVVTPRWVMDAIAAFSRRSARGTQTEEEIRQELHTTEPMDATVHCTYCKHPRIDRHGIFRVFDFEHRCHLCHDSTSASMVPSKCSVDDVTDHDLYHC